MGAPLGNKNATTEKRLITDALRRVVTQNPEKLKKACEKIMDDAVEGNIAAFNMMSDRLEGKPAQSVDLKVTEVSHEDALSALENGDN